MKYKENCQLSMLDADEQTPDEETANSTGLRRSKRNKYHLDVAAVLKSGSSIRRDYSPPAKKWATRKPDINSYNVHQPKTTSPKQRAKKKTSPRNSSVETAKAAEVQTKLKEEQIVGEPSETNIDAERSGQHQIVEAVNQSIPQIRCFSGFRNLEQPLPDQILEEDGYACVETSAESEVKSTIGSQNPDVEAKEDEPSAGKSEPSSSSMDLSAAEVQIKRRRKVPLRLSDYTFGESDVDEDTLFKGLKVEYTLPDGAKTVETNFSCPKCPANYESRVGLTNHLKLHGANKAFPCELCDFSCTNKKTMRQHRKVHGLMKRRPIVKSDKAKSIKIPIEEDGTLTNPASSNNAKNKSKKGCDKVNSSSDTPAKEEEEKFVAIQSLVEDVKSEQGDLEDEEGMPILEQQEAIPLKEGNNEERKEYVRTRTGRKRQNLPTGFYKKGSGIYKRNTIKCPHCPFRTQSNTRLKPHINGHKRTSGFVCSICEFKSDSSNILRRHCQLHEEPFKWPPDCVGIPRESGTGDEVITNSSRVNDGGGDYMLIVPGEAENADKLLPLLSRVEDQSSQNWRAKYIKMPTLIYKHSCIRCAKIFRSPAGYILHNMRRHQNLIKSTRKVFYGELLNERLSWKPETIIESKSTSSEAKQHIVDSHMEIEKESANQNKIDAKTSTNTTKQKESTSKVFHCQDCPYTTDQICRLQKHENKHLVKAEHQCQHCSFSCRSMDILTQHMRLHDNNNNSSKESISQSTSSSMESQSSQQPNNIANETQFTKLPSIRKNEIHYCPYCPYKSKHNCDMKAHLKMHEERRKFICQFCTYSTMRQNALISHEKLHQIGNVEKGETRRLKMICWRNMSMQQRILGEKLEIVSNGSHFYRCAVKECSAEFSFCSDIAKHARHHIWTVKKYSCPICSFRTNLDGRMQSHGVLHKEEEEKNTRSIGGIFHCKECPYATANYAKFWNHRQKHKKASRLACTLCSFSSGSAQCFSEHLGLHNISKEAIEKILAKNMKMEVKEENANHETQAGAATQSTASAIGRRSNELPAFQKEKYEKLSSAMPVTQLKALGLLGKANKNTDNGSNSSSSSSSISTKNCRHCPYKSADSVLLKLHMEMHRHRGDRPFSCNLCSFGCFSAESLHSHLSLHASSSAENGYQQKSAMLTSAQNKATASYQCSQCNFRCLELEMFLAHRKEHVQLFQQRLMTIIKRSTNDNTITAGGLKDKMKLMRGPKTDKQHYCSKCSFHCDSVQAFTLHWEHHQTGQTKPGVFRCSICDYNSQTKNVVIFHEKNHHLDVPLTSLILQRNEVTEDL